MPAQRWPSPARRELLVCGLVGLGGLKGAGQVNGRVSQASTQRTSPEEHPAAN